MRNNNNWLSDRRSDILAMALNWSNILTEEVKAGSETKKKYELWEIPLSEVTTLMDKYTTARDALAVAMNETSRNKITTSACNDTFDDLKAYMRSFKKRRLLLDPDGPLSRQDYLALGFRLPDTTRNRTGTPDLMVRLAVYLTGRFHEAGIDIEYIAGNADDPANKEYRIYYLLAAPGEPAPTSVKELTESFGTKRKHDSIPLEPEDSGKQIFMAPRVENGKKKGRWGPMTSAFVP